MSWSTIHDICKRKEVECADIVQYEDKNASF